MPLTDLAIRNIKSVEKPTKFRDSVGLYLLCQPSSVPGGRMSMWWRFRYKFDGREKMLSLGTYPEITLKEARERRDAARRDLAHGIDPGARRKAEAAASTDTFEAVAREWFETKKSGWAPSHADRIMRRLGVNVFPWIGGVPVQSLSATQLLETLRRAESRGVGETAHRCLNVSAQILRYAVVTGRCERDVSADLRGALAPTRGAHFAAILDKSKLGALLRAFDTFDGTLTVQVALRLAPLVFVRPGELRHMKWADVDFDRAMWRYETSKTKTQHIVPLARQAVALLREIEPLTSSSAYVFPSARSELRPMSDAALLAALRRMGYAKEEQTVHGFRAIARTLLDEELHFKPELIEHQLAHTVRDPLGRAYNRTQHLAERTEMMQAWADFLDKLKAGAW
jgi:integrase